MNLDKCLFILPSCSLGGHHKLYQSTGLIPCSLLSGLFPLFLPCSYFLSLCPYKATKVNGAGILYPLSPTPWLWKLDLINTLNIQASIFPLMKKKEEFSFPFIFELSVFRSFYVAQKFSEGEKALTLRSTFLLLCCPPHIHLDWLPTTAVNLWTSNFKTETKKVWTWNKWEAQFFSPCWGYMPLKCRRKVNA